MEVILLVEPLEGGGFRARTGEPINLTAEGATAEEARRRLGTLLNALLSNGSEISKIEIANGKAVVPLDRPLPADNLYQTDWVYRELSEAIAEGRRQDDSP